MQSPRYFRRVFEGTKSFEGLGWHMGTTPGKHVLVESICDIMEVTLVDTLRVICFMRYTLFESCNYEL